MFIKAFITAFFMLGFGAVSHAHRNYDGFQFIVNLLFNLAACGVVAAAIAVVVVVVARYKDAKLW